MRKVISGCKHYKDCFACPFPDCIEGKHFNPEKLERQQQAKALRHQGLLITEIAGELGKNKRTILRYINDN